MGWHHVCFISFHLNRPTSSITISNLNHSLPPNVISHFTPLISHHFPIRLLPATQPPRIPWRSLIGWCQRTPKVTQMSLLELSGRGHRVRNMGSVTVYNGYCLTVTNDHQVLIVGGRGGMWSFYTIQLDHFYVQEYSDHLKLTTSEGHYFGSLLGASVYSRNSLSKATIYPNITLNQKQIV